MPGPEDSYPMSDYEGFILDLMALWQSKDLLSMVQQALALHPGEVSRHYLFQKN